MQQTLGLKADFYALGGFTYAQTNGLADRIPQFRNEEALNLGLLRRLDFLTDGRSDLSPRFRQESST
jgi:hypothetical protein